MEQFSKGGESMKSDEYEKVLQLIQKTKDIRILMYELMTGLPKSKTLIKKEIDEELNKINAIEKEIYYNYLNHSINQIKDDKNT